VAGADTIKIHGEWIPVKAEVVQLQETSGHADRDQLVAWLTRMERPPQRVFVNHGDPAAADTLRQYLRRAIATDVTVPEHGESFE
jgi:metallo-beta-lactamase family protein